MAHFGMYTNNGLTAVAALEDIERHRDGEQLKGWIYLFTEDDYLTDSPLALKPWIHGGYSLMHRLLEPHFVEHMSIGVPFSNGAQLYSDRETLLQQIEQIAPMHQLLKTFGVDLAIPREIELAGSDHNW